MLSSLLISFIQITGDIACCSLAAICAYLSEKKYRPFFIANAIAFIVIAFGDVYYDYFFRILKYNIADSLTIVVTVSMGTFQLSQAFCWFSIARINKITIFSLDNLAYLLFSFLLIGVLTYYFIVNSNMPTSDAWYQNIDVTLNMSAWVLAIICLSRSRTTAITLLTLGSLLIVSAAMTADCIYMFKMDKLASATSVHITWTIGIITMVFGFLGCLKTKNFQFCQNNSIQVKCCSWISITFLFIVTIIFLLSLFFNFELDLKIGSLLWSLPILLVFSVIVAVLSGNWFSNIILLPINNFLNAIQVFNTGKLPKENNQHYESKSMPYEFDIFEKFIKNAFEKMTNQLHREIKLSAQIGHDLRSPLSALESIFRHLPSIDENKKILIRDTFNHIRDITNNLEKDTLSENDQETSSNVQIANLLDYVLSERRAALSGKLVEIISDFDTSCYGLFVNVIPSEMKRILTNIINNACDAVENVTNPTVNVSLDKNGNEIIINISDNGHGLLNDAKEKIFTRGFTTKNKGSGLGLYHAKEALSNWNGNVVLQRNLDHGCSALITLPAKETPLWFVSNLSFLENSTVICVDDSVSIWNAWQDRFALNKSNIKLDYCNSEEDFKNIIETIGNNFCTLLIDYEFTGKLYTGLNLINTIINYEFPNVRIFFVTSHSNKKEIQQFCIEKEIFLIPKSFALKIPIKIIQNKQRKIILASDEMRTLDSEIIDSSKEIIFYNEQNNLLADLKLFKTTSAIFVQHSFVTEFLTRKLKKQGFSVVIFNYLREIIEIEKWEQHEYK